MSPAREHRARLPAAAFDRLNIVFDMLLEGRVREALAVAVECPEMHLERPPRGFLVTLWSYPSSLSEPRTIDYCLRCGHSPDSGIHMPGGHGSDHDYVDPRIRVLAAKELARDEIDPPNSPSGPVERVVVLKLDVEGVPTNWEIHDAQGRNVGAGTIYPLRWFPRGAQVYVTVRREA